MPYLVDTNVLLRLLDRRDALHVAASTAVTALHGQLEDLYIAVQNAAEFWNVCTRPAAARGGLGLAVEETDRRLRVIEVVFPLLSDLPSSYNRWRGLLVAHDVRGVQVHDARLAALMLEHNVPNILTFNVADFARYPGITAVSPAQVVAATP